MVRPKLTHISRAVPETVLRQDELIGTMERLFPDFPGIGKFAPAVRNSAIESRYSAVPIDWFFGAHGWAERMEIYRREATGLLKRAVTELLEKAELDPAQVDGVVSVSTTGISTPSLDAVLMDEIGFSPWLERTPVWGWGCAGGLVGLMRANQLAGLGGGRRVLLLAAELCTLCFRRGETNSKDLISAAIFGDGAAAALIQPADEGLVIESGAEYRWPDTLGVMGWDVADDGLSVIFSKKIPELVRTEFPLVLAQYMAREEIRMGDIDHFLAHPGGARVIEALEEVYGLPDGAMRESRGVLRDFGNMSSPTVLFVIDEFLKARVSGRRALATTFGPGFTCGIAALRSEFR